MTPEPTRAEPEASEEAGRVRFRLWPVIITLGLVLVVVVNAVFIYIAVSGADDVVPSYRTEER
ncbi:MAG: hypothetical protein HKO65_08375 [Gemmatimonadetes bacterium]|nr:hypothetical protein [Gemmatimonadota bacterium]NNM05102.1 hypothetical protein [Gemmatimonadota bacterium]